MKACKNASRYKGLIKPRCNGREPCEACAKKYQTTPMRKGQEVYDTWFSHLWGTGRVTEVLKTRVKIRFTVGGLRTFDLAHAKQFLKKVI